MANWSELNVDILTSVLERLTNLSDHVRVSGVCSSWRSIAKEYRRKLTHQVHPGLMIPGPSAGSRTFLPLPETFSGQQPPSLCVPQDLKCIGSHQGWLALLDETFLNMYLLNPFTGKKRNLPSLAFIRTSYLHRWNVDKAVMSSSPCEFNCIILIFYGESGLAYCRLSEDNISSWTNVDRGYIDDDHGLYGFSDALYFKERFYLVDHHGTIFTLNLDGSSRVVFLEKLELQPRGTIYKNKFYLVDVDGELYRVLREFYVGENLYYGDDSDSDEEEEKSGGGMFSTRGFQLCKLDRRNKKWIIVRDLCTNHHALFLGFNNSLCLSQKGNNRICFTDDRISEPFCVMWQGFDMGVFDLEDRTIKPLYSSASIRCIKDQPAIWIVPLPW
ncbi:hypothetical protein Dimus_036854 [Dionaea muscipula]